MLCEFSWIDHAAPQARFHPAAFKHSITRTDILTAITAPRRIVVWTQQDDPLKLCILGFDQARRILEIIATVDEDRLLIFHAMKARKTYLKRLEQDLWH